METIKKACSKCKTVYPYTAQFYRRKKTNSSGFSYCCKRCETIKDKEYRAENRERIAAVAKQWYENGGREKQALYTKKHYQERKARYKESKRLYRFTQYGINEKDFLKMSRKQEGRCGICNKVPDTLCIDHNHDTGQVRGLLCRKCNSAIGKLYDDPEIILNAYYYLVNNDRVFENAAQIINGPDKAEDRVHKTTED